MNLDIGMHAVGVEDADGRAGCKPSDSGFSPRASDTVLRGETRKTHHECEARRRETTLPAPSWNSSQRHTAHHFSREGLRGHDRPVAGAARAIPAAETTARAAPPDPAQRLVELTAELGRLAGEIVQVAPIADGPEPNAKFVRAIIRARRRRAEAFGTDLFADPVWDMMLDLLAAQLEGRPVSTSSLCIAAGVPGTTALRWIRQATERGLFVRIADPRDGRGVLVTLSKDTAERMLDQLSAGGPAPAL